MPDDTRDFASRLNGTVGALIGIVAGVTLLGLVCWVCVYVWSHVV